MSPEVARAFDAFPPDARAGLLQVRRLILQPAASLPEIGRLEEALRWGQPAYLTPESGAGSTIRLGLAKTGGFALFVHCRTSLIADFTPIAPPGTRFDGSRAVLFDHADAIDAVALQWLIARALTYHRRAGQPPAARLL
ncbi:MAG TPA: DUF1801 domain-containing protein [Aliiroseovarius sp.]|nr:DUF1801 domain-containing protein [Aliiroseovarius sp.]